MWDFPVTRHSLIARGKDLADGDAWTEFLTIYRPVVYRMARRRGMQDADAHDLAQRVFLAISQAIDGWQPGPSRPPFRAWLVTVSRNAISNALSRAPLDQGSGSSSVMDLLASERAANAANATAEYLAADRHRHIDADFDSQSRIESWHQGHRHECDAPRLSDGNVRLARDRTARYRRDLVERGMGRSDAHRNPAGSVRRALFNNPAAKAG